MSELHLVGVGEGYLKRNEKDEIFGKRGGEGV